MSDFPSHPNDEELSSTSSNCDAIISDDRFLNQSAHVENGGVLSPIFTTLDLLNAMASIGAISTDDLFEYRTLLRRAGYFFMPVSEDELSWYLNASDITDCEMTETAELKSIRENIIHVRMSDWLQLPKEASWLDTTLKTLIRVLKGLWKDSADIPSITVRSNWIAEQIDVRGWAHSIGPKIGDNVVRTAQAAHVLMLLTPLSDAPQEVTDAYCAWVKDRILAPIKEQFPELYALIIEWHRKHIAEIAEMELTEVDEI